MTFIITWARSRRAVGPTTGERCVWVRARVGARVWVWDQLLAYDWLGFGFFCRWRLLLLLATSTVSLGALFLFLGRWRRRRRHDLDFGRETAGLAPELAAELDGVEGTGNDHLVLLIHHFLEHEPAPFLDAAQDLLDLGPAAAACQVQRDGYRRHLSQESNKTCMYI